MNSIILYCRAGFEHDLHEEFQAQAAQAGYFGYAQVVANSGYIVFELYGDGDAIACIKALNFDDLVFARQWFAAIRVDDLPAKDRITPLLALCEDIPHCGDVRVEFADTESGREMATFCRKFTVPLRQALRGKGILTAKPNDKKPVLHLLLENSACGYWGISFPPNQSAYLNGIQRLRFPSGAPSRSTLKLEEAINVFLTEKQRQQWFKPGMTGVDLGACPGGWTYQLVSRGLQVQAIDNGDIDEGLMATGLVKHYAADGFKYQPNPKPVDWLVCDMIEKPDRVAALMASWLAKGWAKRSIFNLKLPMKKRYASYLECMDIISDVLKKHGTYTVKARHLYHDREEITVFLKLD